MVPTWSYNWSAVALRGGAALVFGVALLFWPAPTLLTIIYIFGIFVLVQGVAALVGAFRRPEGVGISWGLLAIGIIAVAAGIATFVWPAITGLILLYIIAFWAIAVGVSEIVAGLQLRQAANEWLLIITGVLSLFFGLVLLFAPVAGALAVTFFVGFYGLVYGVLQLALAWRLRGLEQAGRA